MPCLPQYLSQVRLETLGDTTRFVHAVVPAHDMNRVRLVGLIVPILLLVVVLVVVFVVAVQAPQIVQTPTIRKARDTTDGSITYLQVESQRPKSALQNVLQHERIGLLEVVATTCRHRVPAKGKPKDPVVTLPGSLDATCRLNERWWIPVLLILTSTTSSTITATDITVGTVTVSCLPVVGETLLHNGPCHRDVPIRIHIHKLLSQTVNFRPEVTER